MTQDFDVSVTWEICLQDLLVTRFEEIQQKIKFAIWEQMEFLSVELGCDDPKEIIGTIRDVVDTSFAEYLPKDESFEEEFEY